MGIVTQYIYLYAFCVQQYMHESQDGNYAAAEAVYNMHIGSNAIYARDIACSSSLPLCLRTRYTMAKWCGKSQALLLTFCGLLVATWTTPSEGKTVIVITHPIIMLLSRISISLNNPKGLLLPTVNSNLGM